MALTLVARLLLMALQSLSTRQCVGSLLASSDIHLGENTYH